MAMLPSLHALVVAAEDMRPHVALLRPLLTPATVAQITVLAVMPPLDCDPLFRFSNVLGLGLSQSTIDHMLAKNEDLAQAAAQQIAAAVDDLAPRVRSLVRTGLPSDEVLLVAAEQQVDLIVVDGTSSRRWNTSTSGRDLATDLVRRAECLVLVVRARDEDPLRPRRVREQTMDWRGIAVAWQQVPAALGGVHPKGFPV